MIIITGASKNIGKYLFEKFKEEGLSVIGTYNSTFDGFEKYKDDFYQLNIADYDAVSAFVNNIQQKLKHITLINCAGISYNSFAHKADVKKWSDVIDVNLKGTFFMSHALLPYMREMGYGRIINFSSVIAKLPTQGVSAYAASKAGIVGLTKSLAVENGSKGVTVNAINLGYVNVGMGVNDVPPAYQEKIKSQIPLNRFCNPDEIYSTVKYLMETEYVNGAAIDINGGLI